jgi:hypothetical protein
MKGKFANALSLALIVSMLFTSVAFADVVQNDVATVGDVKLVTITAGDTAGATVLYNINESSGDSTDTTGQNSQKCNAADGTTATITPQGLPSGVAKSPTSVTFSNCTSALGITFTADLSTTPGDYPITVSVSDSGASSGDYNPVPATFTLRVSAPGVTNTPPTVTVTGVTDGESYEFSLVPAAVCEVTDAEDGNSSFAATLSAITGPLAAYGLGSQTASCAYTDEGGLSATPASATYTIADTTAPDVACGTADGLWHADDVSIPCTASDKVALAIPADASFSLVTSVPAGTEDSNASTNSYDVYDVAGNFATAGPVSGNKVDKKAPTNIAFVGGGITDGGEYYFGSVPAGPTSCTADDGGSGFASCNITGGGTTVGSHKFTATATDNVGNFDTAELNYTVLAWTLNGFYQPVDMGGVFNTVKGGSTVPLKFKIFAGPTELTDVSAIKSLSATQAICSGGDEDAIETLSSSGSTILRYDWTSGQFIFNWQTPKKPGFCYKVTMTTLDGSSLSANFKLK